MLLKLVQNLPNRFFHKRRPTEDNSIMPLLNVYFKVRCEVPISNFERPPAYLRKTQLSTLL